MSISKKSPDFYEYYPKLFHDYYEDVDGEKIEILSQAGFDCYNAILSLDALVDNKEIQKITEILNFQEESIKKLSSVFSNGQWI